MQHTMSIKIRNTVEERQVLCVSVRRPCIHHKYSTTITRLIDRALFIVNLSFINIVRALSRENEKKEAKHLHIINI